jgi:hypothetical protein
MSLAALNVWSTSPEADATALAQLLGGEPRRRDADDGPHFTLLADRLMLSIHPADEARVELAFTVDDIAAAVRDGSAAGCTVRAEPEETPYGISARLDSPGQTAIELVQMKAKGDG